MKVIQDFFVLVYFLCYVNIIWYMYYFYYCTMVWINNSESESDWKLLSQNFHFLKCGVTLEWMFIQNIAIYFARGNGMVMIQYILSQFLTIDLGHFFAVTME